MAPKRCFILYATAAGLGCVSDRTAALLFGDQCPIHDLLRLAEDALQVRRIAKALGVDLVDVFGARRPRSEPATLADHLDAANRRAIARRLVEHLGNGITGQFAAADLRRREFAQGFFLLRGRSEKHTL